MTPLPLCIEVVYATPRQLVVRQIDLPLGSTVADALQSVAAEPPFNQLTLSQHSVGVFGQVCETTRALSDGDRVEVYRELQMDAKAARLKRATEQRSS